MSIIKLTKATVLEALEEKAWILFVAMAKQNEMVIQRAMDLIFSLGQLWALVKHHLR